MRAKVEQESANERLRGFRVFPEVRIEVVSDTS